MWEIIQESIKKDIDVSCSDRLHVPGGWIIRTILKHTYASPSVFVSQIFVSDPEHLWEL